MMHPVQIPATEVGRSLTPTTLEDALTILAEAVSSGRVAKPLAGGTDLLVELDRADHDQVDVVVDLTRIPGLADIALVAGRVTIGALVTHNRCVHSELIRDFGLPLAQACAEIGSPQLRNRATVVGNVVTASPANDTISALFALDAQLHLQSARGSRQVSVSDFYRGVRSTVLEPDELVTSLSFDALDDSWHSVYLKLGLRKAQAISVVHVALACCTDENNTVTQSRLALGSVAPTVGRSAEAEAALIGVSLNEVSASLLDPESESLPQRQVAQAAAASVSPIGDVRAPAEYRVAAIEEMVSRAVTAVAVSAATDLGSSKKGSLKRELALSEQPTLWGETQGRWGTGAQYQFDVNRSGPSTPVAITVNGHSVTKPVGESGAAETLLDWLRAAGVEGVKEGCAEGECGACTVHLDGMAVLSCLVSAPQANGTDVRTIEGLGTTDSSGALHPVQQAFVDCGAVQCGYCIPGFLMAAAKLVENRTDLSPAQVKAGLSGNLCRCTGYYKIEDAIVQALTSSQSKVTGQQGGGNE